MDKISFFLDQEEILQDTARDFKSTKQKDITSSGHTSVSDRTQAIQASIYTYTYFKSFDDPAHYSPNSINSHPHSQTLTQSDPITITLVQASFLFNLQIRIFLPLHYHLKF